jgi:hypothetical protein
MAAKKGDRAGEQQVSDPPGPIFRPCADDAVDDSSAQIAEREMIRERVLAGQARAKASGVRFGRPTIPADKAAAIVTGLKAGTGETRTGYSETRSKRR